MGSEHPGGISDEAVLSLARAERRILITDDCDFGELIFRERRPHEGVIYLRLGQYAELADKIARPQYVLVRYRDRLDEFLVVTPRKVRVR